MPETQQSQAGLRAVPGPGTELGSYRILELLGSGGMGQVFLAEHIKLGRRVALKLLLPQFASNAEVIGRFFHEARAVNQINHAHIVEIIDFFEEPGGFNYFIMEMLDGFDLATMRDREGQFGLERTVHIARQICSALTATHEHGIVHRDLKPENVYIVQRENHRDFVKLLDFGIAKLSGTEINETRPRTRAGVILGTPEYMSPEQAGGQPIDGRSDVYALGVILYWMISDELPFRGESMGEILVKQLTQTPPPLADTSASGEPIPRDLARAVEKCLEREPARRVQSAQELIELLAPIEFDGSVPTPRPRRTLVWPILALALAVLTLAGVGIYRLDKSHPSPVPQTTAPLEINRLPPLEQPPPDSAPSPAAARTMPAAIAAPNPTEAETPTDVAKKTLRATARPKKPEKKHEVPDDNSGMIDPFE